MDPWECQQEQWLQTKKVLDHYQAVVSEETEGQAKVKLLCGADLLESFATPGLWAPQDVRIKHTCIITIIVEVWSTVCIDWQDTQKFGKDATVN